MRNFKTLLIAACVIVLALGACTGGDMGNTRGGGAAPGQSGGRDTTGAAAKAAGGAPPAPTAVTADTTKQRATKAKRP